jgi:hypothetical protein
MPLVPFRIDNIGSMRRRCYIAIPGTKMARPIATARPAFHSAVHMIRGKRAEYLGVVSAPKSAPPTAKAIEFFSIPPDVR